MSLVGELRKIRQDIRFALLSHWPELDGGPAQDLGIDVVGPTFSRRASRDRRSIEMLLRHLRCAGSGAWRRVAAGHRLCPDEPVARAYAEADLVIDLSGDSYRDPPGGVAVAHHATFLAALWTGTPYALASQSLGPFLWPNRPCVRYFLDRAELVYIRERRTAAILEDLGVRPDRIEIAPDVAFGLPTASTEPIWAGESMDPDRIPRPWIALSVSAFALGLRHQRKCYLPEMIELCSHLRRRYDASIFLVPHEISPTPLGSDDDRSAASVLRSRMGGPRWLYAIQGDYRPDVLKGLISRCDAAVAARMHAAIAGLSSGVATLPVAWSHKYVGLMEDIGLAEYVWDQSAEGSGSLSDLFDRLWERREPIRAHLLDYCARAQRRISAVVGRLATHLGSGPPTERAGKML
jgi:polysaccharide pyruvyl transferase WcaK-like protein